MYQINRHTIIFLAFILLAQVATAQKTRKAVFIIVDGIPADVIERLHPPALQSIIREGGYARAYVGGEKNGYSQTPTISAVGYNSLLTGTWVNKHNVWDNDILAPNYNYWNIFRLFKQQYPRKTTAVFSTWLDNRTKLVGSEVKEAGNLHPDYYFDGIELDTLTYPHDSLGKYMLLLDEAVTDTASSNIKRIAPDLTWIYLENTDEMGHRYGNGKEMDLAVKQMDKQIARIWSAIQYRKKKFKEDWVVFITTDHGREDNGYHHGGQSTRERTTWIVTNAKNLNPRFKKDQPGIIDIMPSIASFMNIKIPSEKLMEIDGVPLVGKISATNATAVLSDQTINVKWKVIDKTGNAKIWVSPTNFFKTGGKDNYTLMKTVPVSAASASIDVKDIPSDFYKVVIEFPYNDLNRWIIVKNN